MGFSGDLIAGAWTGNDDNESLIPIAGGSLSLRLWRDVMQSVYGSAASFSAPPDMPDEGPSESDRDGLERLLQGV